MTSIKGYQSNPDLSSYYSNIKASRTVVNFQQSIQSPLQTSNSIKINNHILLVNNITSVDTSNTTSLYLFNKLNTILDKILQSTSQEDLTDTLKDLILLMMILQLVTPQELSTYSASGDMNININNQIGSNFDVSV